MRPSRERSFPPAMHLLQVNPDLLLFCLHHLDTLRSPGIGHLDDEQTEAVLPSCSASAEKQKVFSSCFLFHLSFQTKSADFVDKKKQPQKKKEKRDFINNKKTLSMSELATVKPLELMGCPGLVPSRRDTLVKSVLKKVPLRVVDHSPSKWKLGPQASS